MNPWAARGEYNERLDSEASWALAWRYIKMGDRTLKDLDMREMARIILTRTKLWNSGDPWTTADYSNALAGEVGEICNKVKKLRRIQLGSHLRRQSADPQAIIDDIAGELGGLFVYYVMLAYHLGIDPIDAVRNEFNKVSREEGFDIFMPWPTVESTRD